MSLAAEPHYTPEALAERWSLSTTKIRRMFAAEPGVFLIGQPSRRVGRILKRGYYTLRIPHSVAERVHQRHLSRGKSGGPRRNSCTGERLGQSLSLREREYAE